MTLTDEERNELELECINTKQRCKEAWQILLALKKITRTYLKIHDLWRERYERADKKLALEDRLTKLGKKKQESTQLTKQQLLEILEELEEEGGE